MTSIDPNKLLKPISDEKYTGDDIRLDQSPASLYFTIRDVRDNARSIERKRQQGNTDLSALADWRELVKLGQDILINQSKDLEIASWLIEATVRTDGLDGLKNAFLLMHGLLTKYWEELYPLPDEDGLATKVAPLIGLNGEESEGSLIAPIGSIDITQGESKGPYKLWEYQLCIETEKLGDETQKQQRYAAGIPTMEDFTTAAIETPMSFYHSLKSTIQECIAIYQNIASFLDSQCNDEVIVPSSKIIGALKLFDDHIDYVLALTNRKDQASPIQTDPPALNETNNKKGEIARATVEEKTKLTDKTPLTPTPNSIGTMDRPKAIALLKEISSFFKKSEPHSPIPYLIDRAIKWSALPLPELMNEIVADKNIRAQIQNLIGIDSS